MKLHEQADNRNTFALASLMGLVSFAAVWVALFTYSVEVGVFIGVSLVPAFISVVIVDRYKCNSERERSKVGWLALLTLVSALFFTCYLLSYGPFLAYWDTLPQMQYNEKDVPVWHFYRLADRIAYELPVSTPLEQYLDLWSPYGEAESAAGLVK